MRRSRVEFLLFFRLKDILPTELIFNQSFWLVSAGMFWLQAYDLATQVLTNRSFFFSDNAGELRVISLR
jgi:hypothetical protein